MPRCYGSRDAAHVPIFTPGCLKHSVRMIWLRNPKPWFFPFLPIVVQKKDNVDPARIVHARWDAGNRDNHAIHRFSNRETSRDRNRSANVTFSTPGQMGEVFQSVHPPSPSPISQNQELGGGNCRRAIISVSPSPLPVIGSIAQGAPAGVIAAFDGARTRCVAGQDAGRWGK